MTKKCNHEIKRGIHAFAWPENLPADNPYRVPLPLGSIRSVFNLVAPVCAKCGKSIAEIIWPQQKGGE